MEDIQTNIETRKRRNSQIEIIFEGKQNDKNTEAYVENNPPFKKKFFLKALKQKDTTWYINIEKQEEK